MLSVPVARLPFSLLGQRPVIASTSLLL